MLLLVFSSAYSQHIASTPSGLAGQGTSVAKLDSLYKNVLDPDPGQTLFNGKGAAYYDAHVKLFNDLSAFLKQNNFSWGQPVRTITRIYYKKDGSIDYFIYDLSKSGLSAEKQDQFGKLLSTFVQTYQTSIHAGHDFYHRSPYTFKD
ncbi:MAG: hypothetical protein ACXVPQ_09830 [Bacteroidia bacterium]